MEIEKKMKNFATMALETRLRKYLRPISVNLEKNYSEFFAVIFTSVFISLGHIRKAISSNENKFNIKSRLFFGLFIRNM